MNATDVNAVVDKVAGLLEKVATKIGVAADTVWPWLVKQQYVEGITTSLLVATLTIITVVTYKGLRKYLYVITSSADKSRWDKSSLEKINDKNLEALQIIWGCAFGLSLCILFGVLAINIADFQKLFNPEYFALMDLISAAK